MLPLIMAGAGLAAKGYGIYEANKREKEAKKALADLAKTPYAKYGVNPLVKRYTEMGLRDIQKPQGFSGAETADFQSRIAAAQNAARQNAISLGGSSVARAVGGALGSANLAAQNQYAAQNAALARQSRNLGYNRFMQGAGVAQNIENMNTQNELNRRMMTEQAYGAAARQAGDQQRAIVSGFGSDLLGGAFNMYSLDKMYPSTPTSTTPEPGLFRRLGYRLGGGNSNATIQNDMQNAVGKGFTNMPNDVTGFYNDERLPALPSIGMNKPNYMPITTYQMRKSKRG